MEFWDNTSAANSTIIDETGSLYPVVTNFRDHSSAGNSHITLQPTAQLWFIGYATGANATVEADGAKIYFNNASTGGLASFALSNGASIVMASHNQTLPLSFGSLSGDSSSTVSLSAQPLTIGGMG